MSSLFDPRFMKPQTEPEEEIYKRLRSGGGSSQLKRKFLLRLAIALHTYGSSAPRTEFLIEKAADRIGINTSISVFPSLILIAFKSDDLDPGKQETHLLTVEGDLDADKLDKADQLANRVGDEGVEVLVAYWKLKAIATAKERFSQSVRLLSFAVMSATAALLFFSGNMYDGLVALILGGLVGVLDLASSKAPVLAQVQEFIAAIVISFTSRALSWWLVDQNLCFFAMALASLVWLLPGLSLTVGVSELVAKAYNSGSAKITYALFSAMQLGFGLAIGEQLCYWAPSRIPTSCPGSTPSTWWNLLWFAGYTVSSNVILNARWSQWPGMILVAGAGWIVSSLTQSLGDAGSILAAFTIGVTGTLYSHVSGHLPLAMKTSGILMLVPGGIGVKGVTALLTDDVLSGMGFVFDMLVVGLSITIGLLLSKMVLPSGMFGATKTMANNHLTLAQQLEAEKHLFGANESWKDEHDEDNEEHMAI